MKYLPLILATICVTAFAGCTAMRRPPSTFPVASDLRTAIDPSSVLAKARVDFDRLAAGDDPQYAVFETGLYDGGTRYFKGDGYRIVDHHQAMADGKYVVGQTIIFDRSLTGGRLIEYSNSQVGNPRH